MNHTYPPVIYCLSILYHIWTIKKVEILTTLCYIITKVRERMLERYKRLKKLDEPPGCLVCAFSASKRMKNVTIYPSYQKRTLATHNCSFFHWGKRPSAACDGDGEPRYLRRRSNARSTQENELKGCRGCRRVTLVEQKSCAGDAPGAVSLAWVECHRHPPLNAVPEDQLAPTFDYVQLVNIIARRKIFPIVDK